MKLRPPSPATAIALLALFVAITGTGYAASGIVQSGSDTAPATSAKKKKKALSKSDVNKLIAAYVKANKSSLTGAAGAAGAPGAKGATGDTGPSNIYHGTKGGAVNLADTPTTIATLPNLPAGKYLVQAVTTAVNFGAADYIRCHLKVGGTDYPGNTATAGGATVTNELTLDAAVTLGGAGDAVLICSNDTAIVNPYMESTQISAIETGDLQTQTLP